MHVVKIRYNSCGHFRRETSRTGHLSYFCTARNDRYWHKQQLRIKALSIACPLYKSNLTMEKRENYTFAQLQKMELGELYNLALWFKVDTLNKKKGAIIVEILDAQLCFDIFPPFGGTEGGLSATVSSGSS